MDRMCMHCAATFEYLKYVATMAYRGLTKKDLQLFMKLISSSSAHPEIHWLPGNLLTGKGVLFITELIC